MIYKYDFRYSIAKLFVDSALRLNFRKLVITGKENIPDHLPLIFTPNHRNALIDALLIVYANKSNRQVVFLARGDIFRKPLIAWVLHGMRIIPVYRIRDGKDSLSKNGKIFEIAGKVLKNNNPIALFPEATHNPGQSLLPLKKAVPRIVLPAEAQHNFELSSQIIPVSIYYSDVFGFLSDCYVHFGDPIPVANYQADYRENPGLATNKLRADLQVELSKLVVNIQKDTYYDLYKDFIDWNIESVAEEKYANHRDAFPKAAKDIIKQIDRLFENNSETFEQKAIDHHHAKRIIAKHRLKSTDRLLKPPPASQLFFQTLMLLITSPIAVFGFLNALFPIIIYKRLLNLFKDRQFTATVRYVSGLFLIPIFDVIQTFVVRWATQSWTTAFVYFAAMPFSFLVAVHWRRKAKSVNRCRQVNRFVKSFPDEWRKLIELIKI